MAQCYTLRHARGQTARISTYGGTLLALTAPDRHGEWSDVLLGYDSLQDYLRARAFMGALIGRYANRLAKGRFSLNDVEYAVPLNDGANTLHGGPAGFDKRLWSVEQAGVQGDEPQLTLQYASADGEQGFPGTLAVRALYRLTAQNALRIDLMARAEGDTIINLTMHPYFNLRGTGDVLGHRVWLGSSAFLPVDAGMIPTGELRAVAGTVFDFQGPRAIGERLGQPDAQLRHAGGYDHTWVMGDKQGRLQLDARVQEPESGRFLELFSTQPGVQFYTGQQLDGAVPGKSGRRYAPFAGFALEPQHFPDSPHHPGFPSTVLRSGATYHHCLLYRFGVEGGAQQDRACS